MATRVTLRPRVTRYSYTRCVMATPDAIWPCMSPEQKCGFPHNKAGYTATEVACGWAGAVIKMVNKAFGQEQ